MTETETTQAQRLAALAGMGITIESSSPSAGLDGSGGNAWAHIAYAVTLKRSGRVVWSGPYKLGVGHVKQPSVVEATALRFQPANPNSDALIHKAERAAKGRPVTYTPEIEAKIAAFLARAQKVTPSLPDVMNCLLMDGSPEFDAETFEEWAGNFGYDTDSRKAEKIFAACTETGKAFRRAFTGEEIAQLRELFANY